MGAFLSKGGKSFICMSSTVTGKDGTVKSRIVPTLTPGSICTDPRSCTHYIVTEYGIATAPYEQSFQEIFKKKAAAKETLGI